MKSESPDAGSQGGGTGSLVLLGFDETVADLLLGQLKDSECWGHLAGSKREPESFDSTKEYER
jgi:hypothetical protein